jgi:hypothetical protein
MVEPARDTGGSSLRRWWMSPPRSGLQRLIIPSEYRHLRFFGAARLAGGGVAATAGAVCLSYGANGWAAFFLVLAALELIGGSWYLTIARGQAVIVLLRAPSSSARG